MRLRVGSVIALCCLVLLCEGRKLSRRLQSCEKPPNGSWLVSESRPAPTGSDDATTEGRSVLFLAEDDQVPNAYSGNAFVVYYLNNGSTSAPTGNMDLYNVALVFDPETCVMTGVIYNLDDRESSFADAIQWHYDGKGFEGISVYTEPVPNSDVRLIVPSLATFRLTQLG